MVKNRYFIWRGAMDTANAHVRQSLGRMAARGDRHFRYVVAPDLTQHARAYSHPELTDTFGWLARREWVVPSDAPHIRYFFYVPESEAWSEDILFWEWEEIHPDR